MRKVDMAEPIRRVGSRSDAARMHAATMDSNISVRSVALTVLAVAATMYLLHWAREAFIPIVLSILISYALEPIVALFTRIHIHRIIAAGLVVTLTGGALGYGVYSLSDDASAIVAQLPEAAQRLRRSLQRDGGAGAIDQVKKAAEELQKTADQAAGSNPTPKNVTRDVRLPNRLCVREA